MRRPPGKPGLSVQTDTENDTDARSVSATISSFAASKSLPFSADFCSRDACYGTAHRPGFTPRIPAQTLLPRKEVIQPHLPIRLPCYDFTPVMNLTVVSALPKVKLPTSGETHSHGVTGGVYKTRERIHRSMLICDY